MYFTGLLGTGEYVYHMDIKVIVLCTGGCEVFSFQISEIHVKLLIDNFTLFLRIVYIRDILPHIKQGKSIRLHSGLNHITGGYETNLTHIV